MHLVHIFEGENLMKINATENDITTSEYLSKILSNSTVNGNVEATKDQAILRLHQIHTLISNCDDKEALKSVIQHLNCAIGVITAIKQ